MGGLPADPERGADLAPAAPSNPRLDDQERFDPSQRDTQLSEGSEPLEHRLGRLRPERAKECVEIERAHGRIFRWATDAHKWPERT